MLVGMVERCGYPVASATGYSPNWRILSGTMPRVIPSISSADERYPAIFGTIGGSRSAGITRTVLNAKQLLMELEVIHQQLKAEHEKLEVSATRSAALNATDLDSACSN